MFLHSSSRARTFVWCLLPFMWFSRSDLQVQLAWQNLHTHIGSAFPDLSAVSFAFWHFALFSDTRDATFDQCFCPAKCCRKLPWLVAFTWQMEQAHFTEEGNVFLGSMVCLTCSLIRDLEHHWQQLNQWWNEGKHNCYHVFLNTIWLCH